MSWCPRAREHANLSIRRGPWSAAACCRLWAAAICKAQASLRTSMRRSVKSRTARRGGLTFFAPTSAKLFIAFQVPRPSTSPLSGFSEAAKRSPNWPWDFFAAR